MSSACVTRLNRLEQTIAPAALHCVWRAKGDTDETVQARIAEDIRTGKAGPDDNVVVFGWEDAWAL